MKPAILIDATTVVEKKDGLSQYIISLLNNLPAEAWERYSLAVLVNKGLQREEFWEVVKRRGYEIVEAEIAPIGPRRDRDMFRFLRKNKNSFQLFHSTSNQYPVSLKNGIATVHDITFRKYLNSRTWTFNLAKRFLNIVISRALKRSAAVIAVSEYTKQDLVKSYRLSPATADKITVIHEGWEHLEDNKEKPVAGEQLPVFDHYLFYVGTTRLHKNMKNLLKAFRLASAQLDEQVKLVISGNETYLDEEDKKELQAINAVSQRVVFTGFVSNAGLASLFRNADAFIFPSLSEGFGIPVLEAFYFKRPLLCSNTTSLPEIAGDAALYFDPSDPSSIAKAIVSFYQDPSLTAKLVEKGQERLQQFSWKKAAEATLALYTKVLDRQAGHQG